MENLFYVNVANISLYLCSVIVIFVTFVRLQVCAVFTLI
jgi:hypothetical protein